LLYWRGRVPAIWGSVAAGLGVIVIHIGWKQVFAIDDGLRFAIWGFAERTLWGALLLGAALAAGRLAQRRIALGLALAGLAHGVGFTLLYHNPLWSEQAVWLWLAPAYAVLWALLSTSARLIGTPVARRVEGIGHIALILLFSLSALRWAFHGPWLIHGSVTLGEDIARSLVAIALALGFLGWGMARSLKDWRIASLLLMLGAVGKVFLFDAAGLDGLQRIASFIALGLSLIGIGWLYSRYLPDTRSARSQDLEE
jgi:uncharacterized membrane protein